MRAVIALRYTSHLQIALSLLALWVLCNFVSVAFPLLQSEPLAANQWFDVAFVVFLNNTPCSFMTLPLGFLMLFGLASESPADLLAVPIYWACLGSLIAGLVFTKRAVFMAAITVVMVLSSVYWNVVMGKIWFSA